jgi:hypothetical protein
MKRVLVTRAKTFVYQVEVEVPSLAHAYNCDSPDFAKELDAEADHRLQFPELYGSPIETAKETIDVAEEVF